MLDIRQIDVAYGIVPVLRDLSLTARPSEILCLVGRNGAGKTTTMKSIMGLLSPSKGEILFEGQRISGIEAHLVPKFGIGYVPQGRRLFGELTVAENLAIGLMTRHSPRRVLDGVLALFPRLEQRLQQRSDTLSGGEQTMLAVGRALCLDPSVLLLDEPTEGLQPSMIAAIRDVIVDLKRAGKAIILVEQRMDAVLAVADRIAFLETGRVIDVMDGDLARRQPELLRQRLGV